MNKIYLILILLAISTLYLIYGFSNLISLETNSLPIDLALRYHRANDLIINQLNIYEILSNAQYPPSTYYYLSFLSGNIQYNFMDEVWAVFNFLSLTLISVVLYKLSIQKKLSKYILPLSFLTFHAIPHGLGVGQITIIVIGTFIVSIWILLKEYKKIIIYILSVILLSFSLGKFSLLIPFAIVMLFDYRLRIPIILAIIINIIISQIIMMRVSSNIFFYLKTILSNSSEVGNLGTIDLQSLIHNSPIPDYFFFPIMLLLLISFTIVIYKGKSVLTIWDQFAIASITARLFIYHNHYDNLILIFVLISLYLRFNDSKQLNITTLLYFLTLFSLIVPARFLIWDAPFYGIFLIFQLVLWISIAIYIINNRLNEETT